MNELALNLRGLQGYAGQIRLKFWNQVRSPTWRAPT